MVRRVLLIVCTLLAAMAGVYLLTREPADPPAADMPTSLGARGIEARAETHIAASPRPPSPTSVPAPEGASIAGVVSRDVELSVLFAAPPVTVTVLDAGGQPVIDASVSVMASPKSHLTIANGQTDRAGRVGLARLRSGETYWLRVWVEDRAHLPEVTDTWVAGDTTVRLRRASTIAGVVVDERGRPPGPFSLHVRLEGRPHSTASLHTEPDGRFVLRGLEPGVYVLRPEFEEVFSLFSFDEPPGDAPEVEVHAGDEAVRLVLPVEPTLAARLIDPRDESIYATLFAEPSREKRSVSISADGRMRFRRCDPKVTYSLWIPPTSAGEMVWVTGLSAPADITVRSTMGKAIQVRVLKPSGDPAASVQASRGPIFVQGQRGEDGTYQIVGLPDGTYEVSAHVSGETLGRSSRKASAEVEAGGSVVLTIPPDELRPAR